MTGVSGQGDDEQGWHPPSGSEQGWYPPRAPAPPPPGYGDQGYGNHGYGQDYGYAYGTSAPLPTGMYLDPESGLVLPQGVRLASVGRRIGAYFLSFVLVVVTLFVGYLVWGAIAWSRGQTPALQVLGMRCWRPETNRVAGFWWMAFREVVGRFAEGLVGVFTLLLSLVLMATRRDRRCLHDLVAGTVVLHDPGRVLGQGQ